jgi:hypothetical protein
VSTKSKNKTETNSFGEHPRKTKREFCRSSKYSPNEIDIDNLLKIRIEQFKHHLTREVINKSSNFFYIVINNLLHCDFLTNHNEYKIIPKNTVLNTAKASGAIVKYL